MTNEEAIEILQEEHDWVQEPYYVIKAIEMAISALRMSVAKNETTTQPAHIDREAWVSVEDRMPKYNIREDGELVSSKILVRCEIDKTVHLVVSKKFYTGRPGEMVHSVFRFYDEWGDIIENVSHWMPLPEPPTDLEKRIGVRV